MAGLTVIEGIEASTALVVLAEVGPDVSKFPSVKHFTSWLGLCPQHQGSAGKVKSIACERFSLVALTTPARSPNVPRE